MPEGSGPSTAKASSAIDREARTGSTLAWPRRTTAARTGNGSSWSRLSCTSRPAARAASPSSRTRCAPSSVTAYIQASAGRRPTSAGRAGRAAGPIRRFALTNALDASSPTYVRIDESTTPWRRLTLAVLRPVVPPPIASASTTTTSRPPSANSAAVLSPDNPAPMTRTSQRGSARLGPIGHQPRR